ncbi:MAG: arylesterase [Pseudomonadota bacterium]
MARFRILVGIRQVVTTAALLLVSWSVLIATAHAGSAEKPQTLVAFGDSLTAGFGLKPSQSFPAQLEVALRKAGRNVRVLNAGVSGDTTGAGLSRFDWAVPPDADAVILELGANDALRGLPVADTKQNLNEILVLLKEKSLPVLIAGFPSPSNWGDEYQVAFSEMFPKLAAQYNALHYPNFLDGVAQDPKLNLSDGLHPNAEGIAVIVERILPTVLELLDRTAVAKSG